MINLRNFLHYLCFIALLIPIIYSCRPVYKPDPIFATDNDFEKTIGWVQSEKNNSQTVIAAAGYKSNYGCSINKDNPFGYIFKISYPEISRECATEVQVSFMCKKISSTVDSCNLVCSFEDLSGKLLEWKAQALKADLNGDEDWVLIQKKFPLTGYAYNSTRINIAVWNHYTAQAVFVDNIKLEFY